MGHARDIAINGMPADLRQWIAGRWIVANSGSTFAIRNPATGALVARVPDGDSIDARRAIEAAAVAFPEWSKRPPSERRDVLRRIGDLILRHREPLARLVTMEEGKPIREARGEIGYAADFFHFFAEEGKRACGEILPSSIPGKQFTTWKQPVGVAGIIPIWNFPAAGIARPLAAALAAGCTAVVKPAEQAPISALALGELFEEAGLPTGVANLVTSNRPETIGAELIASPVVRKLSFTGSLEVGRQVLRAAAEQVKRVTLELGGHAPFVVFEDADLDAAVLGAVRSKFRNAGQTCIALNRLYVHESIASEFTGRFVEQVRALLVGDPQDENVDVGPLIDADALQKVERQVRDGVAKGAEVLTGGRRCTGGSFDRGCFFEPTILGQARPSMAILEEETFGPVAPIILFKTEEEVLAQANALPYGLAAFAFTRDLARARRVAERLEYGIVGVNDALPGAADVPFGGLKQSGLGKEGGRLGLEEFLDTKLVSTCF
jgi:succinate-semialdehyde dehydrogenase/glutarate-semialdehyde dehydrogenase